MEDRDSPIPGKVKKETPIANDMKTGKHKEKEEEWKGQGKEKENSFQK